MNKLSPLLLVSLVACATEQPMTDDPVDPTPPTMPAPKATPSSCVLGAHDGEQTLYVHGKANMPWTAYCADMSTGSPKEYLSLTVVGAGKNFSSFASPGSTVVTVYTKVRIDPSTLMIEIDDQRFATSTGTVDDGATVVTSMPFAIATSLDPTLMGAANIDLHGTPFMYEGAFDSKALGGVVATADQQAFDLTGGGGWTGPDGASALPYNTSGGGWVLQLTYAP